MTTTSLSPHPVVARAVTGDTASIEQLVRDWCRPIRRWTLAAMGDRSRADDAAQDALMRMLRGLPSVDPTRPFGPWLRTLVRNTCIDHQRRRGRMDARHQPIADTATAGPSPAARLDLHRGAHRALEALAELTERQREVLLAVDHDGMTPTELAAELDLAPGTVRALLFKARRTLRIHLLAHNPDLAALVGATP